MRIDFRASDFDDIRKDINRLPGLLGTRVYGAGLVAAGRAVAVASRKSPPFKTRTGTLIKSFRARKTRSRVGGKTIRGSAAQTFTRRAPHGGLVQHGHGPPVGPEGSKPYPVFVPILRRQRTVLTRVALQAMQKEYNKLQAAVDAGSLTRDARRLARART